MSLRSTELAIFTVAVQPHGVNDHDRARPWTSGRCLRRQARTFTPGSNWRAGCRGGWGTHAVRAR